MTHYVLNGRVDLGRPVRIKSTGMPGKMEARMFVTIAHLDHIPDIGEIKSLAQDYISLKHENLKSVWVMNMSTHPWQKEGGTINVRHN